MQDDGGSGGGPGAGSTDLEAGVWRWQEMTLAGALGGQQVRQESLEFGTGGYFSSSFPLLASWLHSLASVTQRMPGSLVTS